MGFFDSRYFLRGKGLRLSVTFCSCTGFLLLGYDQGVMGSIIGADNRFGQDFNHPDATRQGLITSVYDLGCVLGSIISFFIGEAMGRRKMMLFGASIMIVGTILLGSSYSLGQLYVGRIVTGLGNGFNSSTIPVYQSECALAAYRGVLLTWQAVVTILGVVIAYWIGFGTSFTDSSVQWRFPISFQALFAISLVIECFFLPETPRWLIQQGRSEEAAQVLADLLGGDTTPDSDEVVRERIEIETAVELESRGGPFRIKELFEGGPIQNFRRMLLSIGINIMQQFTGSNMINYYAPIVYQETMGMDRITSLIMAGCTEIVYLIGSLIPLWCVEKFGRRNLLIASSAGLSFCFIMVSILLSIGTERCAIGASVFVYLYQLFMGIGWLPVPWYYPAELNTTRLRSRVQAIGSAFNWMSVFAVVQITPIAIQNIGWKTFIIFAILCAVWIIVIFCLYPETSGLELEDIDHIFERPGLTRGVFTTRGKTVEKHAHARAMHLLEDEKASVEEMENGDGDA
ncbi:unnamed protein product [Kuraishia capsulata CBS 1993]|uniref:Major facilitator superfamily (MFS) profile domain-containing protein n=1 Tax=Kuraishia capsulata CBS 1993 TaxID=1382522 RepID=W6MPM2_9ASCO|nr:uncharacterized protein KUCA_T00004648001 [Kuraishia capsulata CBS 1993]CDK28664.1 unnamed protein product [Kuraishia capsulata CBS 1993]